MSEDNIEIVMNSKPVIIEGELDHRKLYQKPILHELGDLRSLTLGVSFGVGDSGNPGYQKPL
jgi:hypothetical protein